MAGSGKTTKLNKAKYVIRERNEAFETFVTACPTHKACKLVKGKTIHRLFNINPIDNSYEYGKVSELKSEGIEYIFIDEVSMVQERIWSVLAHIKTQFGFTFIGYGDFKQLKPVNEEHIDFFNSWIVKYVFGGKLCKLTTVHRFNDSKLLQDAYKCADGDKIDFDDYGHDEHDLALCYTNAAVDAVNEKWNTRYSSLSEHTVTVVGFKQSKYVLHEGLPLMAYKTAGSGVNRVFNSEEFIVKSFNDKHMILTKTDDDTDVKLEIKNTNIFKPIYGITVHKAQGMTITRPYSIYEYEKMRHDMLYVSLTRTSAKEHVNFCKVTVLKPYTGYIYRYSFNGKSYIGSTRKPIKERQEEHRNCNKTYKFGRALKEHGYDNFQFEILETVRFGEASELHDLENDYIAKYDAIGNGFNTRRNVKHEQDCD